ncbi:MAG: 40S ribosomal protein S3a/S1 [archaeon]|nr:40S ribosomal protein S3a/S1 [archaeon]
MSVGKNKKNFSKGRKGIKKKVGDRFLKKEWWKIRAPGMFANRYFTHSPVNQTQGKKLSSDQMKGRVYEANYGDLTQGQTPAKKIKLIVDDADGASKVASTNFYGLDTTRDALCFLIRKWQSLIEVHVDCKTSDGFLLRFFVICFTAKNKEQQRALCYAQKSQIKQIRAIIRKILIRHVSKSTLKELVLKLLKDTLPTEMEQKCKKIFPIKSCLVRKVKTIKRPRLDMAQLQSMQGEGEIPGMEEKKETEQKEEEKKSDNLLNA